MQNLPCFVDGISEGGSEKQGRFHADWLHSPGADHDYTLGRQVQSSCPQVLLGGFGCALS